MWVCEPDVKTYIYFQHLFLQALKPELSLQSFSSSTEKQIISAV